jgi:hypothetical protein
MPRVTRELLIFFASWRRMPGREREGRVVDRGRGSEKVRRRREEEKGM